MAVTSTHAIGGTGSLYVPWRGQNRVSGPVGTLHQQAFDVGDAGGGTVIISVTCPRQVFGFHPILVPTSIAVIDSLGTAEPVMMSFTLEGNERLVEDHRLHGRNVKNAGGLNVTNFPREDFLVVIEPNIEAGADVMQFLWDTNEDTKIYRALVFFLVYDAEQLARMTELDYGALLL